MAKLQTEKDKLVQYRYIYIYHTIFSEHEKGYIMAILKAKQGVSRIKHNLVIKFFEALITMCKLECGCGYLVKYAETPTK